MLRICIKFILYSCYTPLCLCVCLCVGVARAFNAAGCQAKMALLRAAAVSGICDESAATMYIRGTSAAITIENKCNTYKYHIESRCAVYCERCQSASPQHHRDGQRGDVAGHGSSIIAHPTCSQRAALSNAAHAPKTMCFINKNHASSPVCKRLPLAAAGPPGHRRE